MFVRRVSLVAAASLFIALPSLTHADKPRTQASAASSMGRLLVEDLPMPHDWISGKENRELQINSFSFDFTDAPSAVVPPPPAEPEVTPRPTPAPTTASPSAAPTPAPTEKEVWMPMIKIRLALAGNENQKLSSVLAMLQLFQDRLKVKGKHTPFQAHDNQGNGNENGNNGNGNNGNNGEGGGNNKPNKPVKPTEGAEATSAPTPANTTAPTAAPTKAPKPDKPDKPNKPANRYLQETQVLEADGVLCTANANLEDTDISLDDYGDDAKVQELMNGVVDGSIPLTLEDGTPVRDTICQATTTMQMVIAPLDDNSGSPTDADGPAKLSKSYIILIAVLGSAVVLFVGIFLFRRRSAASRVTGI